MAADNSFATKVAEEARSSISNVVETHYAHKIHIDDAAGIYDCDCSGFVQYLLGRTAPDHLTTLLELGLRNPDKRPLAYNFYDFFHGLPTDESAGSNGWIQITRLEDATLGDIVAWKLHGPDEAGDTGHVFVVAEAPTPLTDDHGDNTHFAVKIYDASSTEHFNDSRSAGGKFHDGIGAGTIHIETNASGVPCQHRFGEATRYHTSPTAIGRIVPFPSG